MVNAGNTLFAQDNPDTAPVFASCHVKHFGKICLGSTACPATNIFIGPSYNGMLDLKKNGNLRTTACWTLVKKNVNMKLKLYFGIPENSEGL